MLQHSAALTITNWPNTIQCLGSDDIVSLGITYSATEEFSPGNFFSMSPDTNSVFLSSRDVSTNDAGRTFGSQLDPMPWHLGILQLRKPFHVMTWQVQTLKQQDYVLLSRVAGTAAGSRLSSTFLHIIVSTVDASTSV